LEDGGLGGNGLFNLTWEGEEVTVKLGSEFSLVWLCLRGVGLDLAELLGLDEDGSSAASFAVAFLGSMKCFIFAGGERERERERFEVAVGGREMETEFE
jgi:hypothetical protein